jgi:hypothetical protein
MTTLLPQTSTLSVVFILLGFSAACADDLPKTLMTTRGKLLAEQNFEQTPPPFTGKPVGFASGFLGWRYTAQATGGKGGHWELANGVFTGMETPGANHPATASFGIPYQDAIIQCDVRLDDVPAEGRQYRSLFIKATDAKDYVCALFLSTGGVNGLAYNDTRIDPKTKQRDKFPALHANATMQLNEWHTAVLEIKGDEMVATLDGTSVTIQSPLLAAPKQSVMLGAATQASFRHLRIWEALPNPDWAKNKEALPAKNRQDTAALPAVAPVAK